MSNRIEVLDGWRAISALGVVWIHTWSLCGNPSLNILGINIFKLCAIFGNGVDFFFVISGFCLFLVLSNKEMNLAIYFQFLKKRWLRIAPTFYFVALFTLFFNSELFNQTALFKIIANGLFLHNFIPESSISPPFWSLAVEFHFYLFLPFIVFLNKKVGFVKMMTFFLGLGLVMNLIFRSDGNGYQIVTKILHFCIGIIAAHIYANNKQQTTNNKQQTTNNKLGSIKMLILGIIITFLGRILMANNFVEQGGFVGLFAKCFAPSFLVIGFGIILLNSLFNLNFSKLLCIKPLLFIGKISYSFYLWHALVIGWVHTLYPDLTSPLTIFLIVLILLLPISYFSYYFIERHYQLNK